MRRWLSAFRLRTLPLAVSSILVGSACALALNRNAAVSTFDPMVLLLALITAVLLQVLSNLANDLGDHQHGTDNKDRVGPQRTVQSGAISAAAMKRAMVICGVLALMSGCGLIVAAFGMPEQLFVPRPPDLRVDDVLGPDDTPAEIRVRQERITWGHHIVRLRKMLVFFLLGLLAIGAAVKYTFGKKPYGYAGLGDVSVFLFFGIVGVCGTYVLHTRYFHGLPLLPAVAFGLLSAGVLNVNNMRDIVNDAASGKRTLVVRLGSAKAKAYHTMLVVGGIAFLVFFTALSKGTWQKWVFLLIVPGFVVHLQRVLSNHEPRALDPQLKVLALGTFITAVLFSLGIILAL